MAEPTVVVGHVTRAHGIKGEVAVEVRSDEPARFADGATVFTETGRSLEIERSQPHGRRMLVKFVGVEDRAGAEALRGTVLVVPESWLPELPDGEYWPFQLEGCEVITRVRTDRSAPSPRSSRTRPTTCGSPSTTRAPRPSFPRSAT